MVVVVQSKLREAAVREPRIAIYSNDSWGAGSGVLLQLVKEGGQYRLIITIYSCSGRGMNQIAMTQA